MSKREHSRAKREERRERARASAAVADVEFFFDREPSDLLPALSLALTHSRSLLLTHKHAFSQLAARIAVSNLHKNTLKSFSET